ncbi:MAG: flavin reductase family protein [Clostridia bacterium]|nr:flavin reductase family protein [Clostridia bacterium]
MDRITLREAQKLSSPNPFALISTVDEKGRNNLMALSWWTYCSNNPPTVAVCLSKKGYSGCLIKATGEFALCLPNESLQEAAFRCGTCSGRDTDKAQLFGITLESASEIAPMLVSQSKVALECRSTQIVETGDHYLFVADVVAAHGDPGAKHLLAEDGYTCLAAY